jgi:hypothetical protein
MATGYFFANLWDIRSRFGRIETLIETRDSMTGSGFTVKLKLLQYHTSMRTNDPAYSSSGGMVDSLKEFKASINWN